MKKLILVLLLPVVLLFQTVPGVSNDVSQSLQGLERTPYHPIYEKGKWGFANDQGHIVIQPKFDDFDGRAWLFQSEAAHPILPRDAMQAVAIGNKWQFVSYRQDDGRAEVLLTEIQAGRYLDSLSAPSEELSRAMVDGRYGYLNTSGAFVISPKYQNSEDFSDGLAAVKQNGEWIVINTSGKMVRPMRLGVSNPERWAPPAFGGSVFERLNNGVSTFDLRFLIYPENRLSPTLRALEAIHFSPLNDLSAVRISGKWGYLTNEVPVDNPDKSVIIAPQYEEAQAFSQGLAAVRLNGKWGYIDEGGQIVISPKYARAGAFSNGLAAVKLDGKYGYIDKTGQMIISAQYDRAGIFNGKVAPVLLDQVLSYIDTSGKIVFGGYSVLAGDFNHQTSLAQNLIEINPTGSRPDETLGAPATSDPQK